MQGRIVALAARYAGRPVLMEPRALEGYAARIRDVDARAFERPGRVEALFRKLSRAARPAPLAMDDDDFAPPPPLDQRLAYVPRFIGEPDDLGYCWALKDGVALMCVDTPLMAQGEEFCGVVYHGYDTLLNGMAEAKADDRVKAIWIKMDTPGGVAAPGIVALAAWMRANRAAAGGKPIWVYAEMACSAGMWVAAQADKIVAPTMGYLGSVGAYTLHEDDTGYLDKVGIKITEIKFGAKKTDGAPWKALSDSAKADIQAEIDQLGSNFLADMVAGRPQLTREALLETQAACYFAQTDDPARSGLKLGFCDAIMTEEESFAALLASLSIPATGISPVLAPAGAAKTETSTKTDKEQPMASTAEDKAAKLAALNTELTTLSADAAANAARITAIKAELKAEGAKPKDGEDEPMDPADEQEDQQDGGADEDQEEGDEGDDQKKKNAEAAKISGSAEAMAHPHLALAAIQTGQTLAQFQATVKAQAAAPKSRGALAEALANGPRMAPDAGKPGGGSMLVENARKRGGA